MYSPVCHAVSHTMTNKSKKTVKPKRQVTGYNAGAVAKDVKEMQAAIRRLGHAPKQKASSPFSIDLNNLATNAGNGISSLFGLGKIFGSGEYKLEQNSLMQNIGGNQVPVMHSANESVRVRHREFIANVNSTSAFTLTSYSINPGMAATFPYLASIARNFQEYRFKGLIFEFKSTSGTSVASTNTALGTIMLGAQYRADAPDFTSKRELLNEMWSTDAPPCSNVILPIECAPNESPMSIQYIRSGSATGDVKFYDLARFYIGSEGAQATSVAGELWASYEVDLYKPQINEPGPSPFDVSSSHWRLSGVTNGLLLGTLQFPIYNGLGITLTSTTVTIPYGTYFIAYSVVGTATTLTSGGAFFVASAGASLVDVYQAGSTATNYAANPGATLVTSFVATCVVTNPSTTSDGLVTLTNWVLPASVTAGDLTVTPYQFGVTN